MCKDIDKVVNKPLSQREIDIVEMYFSGMIQSDIARKLKVNPSTIYRTLRRPHVKKAYFEIVYATVIKVDDAINDKKSLEKIILCDVQKEIYSDLENAFVNLLHSSGYPGIKFEKKIDFEELYNRKFN